MNKIVLLGRPTKKPEITVTKNENSTKVARYTLAVNKKFVKDGEPNADFISCVCFGKVAEFAESYLARGEQILVSGRLQTGSYKDNDGNTKYTFDVVVEEHYFCGSKSKGGTDVESVE